MVVGEFTQETNLLVIGGGAVLDVVGFAAATAHRGVRLLRLPSTTLAQADAGIGVKNGVNAFGTKNFLGTFAVPRAVIIDEAFLATLTDRDWRCGLSDSAGSLPLHPPGIAWCEPTNGDGLVDAFIRPNRKSGFALLVPTRSGMSISP